MKEVTRVGSCGEAIARARRSRTVTKALLVAGIVAATQADEPLVSPAGGVREWLNAVERPRTGVGAAAFDTRIDKPRVPGSAARGAAKRLRRLGFRVVAAAESFYVSGTKGPLVPGEVERAHRWAEQVAARLAPIVTTS